MAMFQEKLRNIFFTTNDYRNYQAEVTTYDNSDYKVNIYMKKHYYELFMININRIRSFKCINI